MATSETWRVVLATGEVREVAVEPGPGGDYAWCAGGLWWGTTRHCAVAAWCVLAGDNPARQHVAEILAPGEPTRAELAAQLATATASVRQLRADVELATAQRDAETCRADNAECERGVLLAQQAPLLDAHDALVAAARAAGWTGAGATGAELVAWVRRGAAEECAARCDADAEAEEALGRSDGAWALRFLAKSIRVRAKGGE